MFLLSTGNLFLMRQAMIFWTHVAVWPLEVTYNSIIDELESRGHKLEPIA
jgi:hypothetical protein